MPEPRITDFGRLPDGASVQRVELWNRNRVRVTVLTLGATIQGAWAPDRHGAFASVVLGADSLEAYLGGFPAAAAVIGRVANRIAGARFTLEGREYTLPANDGPNSLHGGPGGFAHRLWRIQAGGGDDALSWVRLSLTSPDGDQGYPGTMTAAVRYALDDRDELTIGYEATTDRLTPVNLTNHAYFNLAGGGDVLGHTLRLDADRYTPVGEGLIPTGAIEPVVGTPLDFTTPARIGERIAALDRTPAEGYDHNLVLRDGRDPDRPAGWLAEPASGRQVTVFTTQPAIQLYSGNQLRPFAGHEGRALGYRSGVCLETQHYPDSVHHPEFPSILLAPGRTFRSTTRYRFEVVR